MNIDQLIYILNKAKEQGIIKGTDGVIIADTDEDTGIVSFLDQVHFTDNCQLYESESSYRVLYKT
jgi:hypothetical protein